MSRPLHILVPHFASLSPFYADALASQPMPQLQAWLAKAQVIEAEPLTPELEARYSAPHERWLAKQSGMALEDTGLPLAALCNPALDATPQAWLQLCHWQVGREHLSLSSSSVISLDAQEDAALFAAIAQLLIEDGFTLSLDPINPGRWLVAQPRLAGLRCAAPERAQGRNVRNWQPQGEFGTVWRRIANELQMLLYTHPVNEAREARGALPANSVWLWGSGKLPKYSPSYFSSCEQPESLYRFIFGSDESLPTLEILSDHSTALLCGDWPSLTEQLKLLDDILAPHLAQPNAQLTLCGERRWVTLAAAPQSAFKRFLGNISRNPPKLLLASLPEL